jgi:ankyrin repeat protein
MGGSPSMRKIFIILAVFVILVSACESKQEKARNNLKKLNIDFTAGSFVESAKNSDIVAVENFLEAGMNPNIKNDAGCSAMFYAVIQKNEKMISFLKEHGAKEVNGDRFIGKWGLNGDPKIGTIEISKEGDQYIWWGGNPYNIDDDKPYPTKAKLINDNTLRLPQNTIQPNAVEEVKLGEDDILTHTVSTLGLTFHYRRISK